jgi:hypothetical protein
VLDQAFLLGVAVEARHRAQPAGDRRPRSALGLEVTRERFDVDPLRGEQMQLEAAAPDRELT